MSQVLLAVVIVLLVIIIIRQPRGPHFEYAPPRPRPRRAGRGAAAAADSVPMPGGAAPPMPPAAEGFPEKSVLEERHMGPDSLIDLVYSSEDGNSIYDEFTTQNH